MRLSFKDISIKIKIVVIIISICSVALVLSGIIFFAYDRSEFEKKTIKGMTILAEVIGQNNTANLSFPFNGKDEARKSLYSIVADKHIQLAIIFDENQDVFAEFVRDAKRIVNIQPEYVSKDTVVLSRNSLIVVKPIKIDKEVIGSIYIDSDLDEYSERLLKFITILATILFSALLIAFLLSLSLQKIISRPILILSDIMKDISVKKDYSVRLEKKGNDEIGELFDGFNQMLSQIDQQNIALKLAKEQAESSARIKEQFLANMSHEIRTPMNAITGMTDLMLETNINPKQTEYLEYIKKSSDNLLVIINDILDFSKIEAKKIEFENIEFDLHELINNIKNILKYKSNEKKLAFNISIESKVPRFIIGDPVRLNQILLNLSDNAVKYTKAGSVTITVKTIDRTSATYTIQFLVSDTGIGIEKDKLSSVFDSFTQASSSTTRQYGGSGLGLTISKQLVELQGGKISVTSEEGKGSTFAFHITFGKAFDKPDVTPEKSQKEKIIEQISNKELFKDLKILIVDDNKINQILVSSILKKYNFTYDTADDGKQAIDKIQEDNFNLVLMDLHMPVMDGYDTTQFIRTKIVGQKKDIPIIALTAAAIKGEKEKCFSVGVDDYISKPFKAEDLIKKILNLLYN